ETQVVLPRLTTDLIDVVEGLLDQKEITLEWSNNATLGVVLASKGYPESYAKGAIIEGLNNLDEKITVFHAGTDMENDQFVTNGGRVLTVVASGENLEAAQKFVYQEVVNIKCDNLFYRKDIGNKAIAYNSKDGKLTQFV